MPHEIEVYRGVKATLYTFCISEPDGGEWLILRSGRFTPRETGSCVPTRWIRGLVSPTRGDEAGCIMKTTMGPLSALKFVPVGMFFHSENCK
jgi:hypothetical protein